MENSQENIIKRIKNAVKQDYPDADVYLYGSRARGDYNKDSDWDILVLTEDNIKSLKDQLSLQGKIDDIEIDIGELISLIIYSKKHWKEKVSITPFYQEVKNEGIKL